jgi:hypothetical protein
VLRKGDAPRGFAACPVGCSQGLHSVSARPGIPTHPSPLRDSRTINIKYLHYQPGGSQTGQSTTTTASGSAGQGSKRCRLRINSHALCLVETPTLTCSRVLMWTDGARDDSTELLALLVFRPGDSGKAGNATSPGFVAIERKRKQRQQRQAGWEGGDWIPKKGFCICTAPRAKFRYSIPPPSALHPQPEHACFGTCYPSYRLSPQQSLARKAGRRRRHL